MTKNEKILGAMVVVLVVAITVLALSSSSDAAEGDHV